METPVFVNEDVVYRTADHTRVLMFARPAMASVAFNRISYKSPPWTLFADTFAGAYSVQEAIWQASVTGGTPGNPAQSLAIYVRKFARHVEYEQEDGYRRTNHALGFLFINPYVAQLVGKSFAVPDFNDFPWLEWLQPPKDPASALLPFRQVAGVPMRGQQFNLYFDQPKPYKVEAEEFSGFYAEISEDLDAIHAFRWRPEFTPGPPGFRVMCVTAGEYAGQYYVPGDVFDIATSLDYSDSNINYQAGAGESVFGWMQQVPPYTPLYQWLRATSAPFFPPQDPKRKFIM